MLIFFYGHTRLFFQDFFPFFNFGHFFCPIFKNQKYFWKKKSKSPATRVVNVFTVFFRFYLHYVGKNHLETIY
jgi:hypothetical protein